MKTSWKTFLGEVDIDIEDEADKNDIVSDDLADEKDSETKKNMSQVEKDLKKKAQDKESEEFGAGLEGDSTGRNQERLMHSTCSNLFL